MEKAAHKQLLIRKPYGFEKKEDEKNDAFLCLCFTMLFNAWCNISNTIACGVCMCIGFYKCVFKHLRLSTAGRHR